MLRLQRIVANAASTFVQLRLLLYILGRIAMLPVADACAATMDLSVTGGAIDGRADDTEALRDAIRRAGAAGTVEVSGPAYIAAPGKVTVPAGASLAFSGEGRLVLAFGSVRRIRITAHGTGYLSVPTVGIEGSAKPGPAP